MLEVYEMKYNEGLYVYEGINEVLDHLVDHNYKIAVLTNKDQAMARPIVTKHFEAYEFENVIGFVEGRERKPNPPKTLIEMIEAANISKDKVFYVGDSEVDLMTARNAKVNEVIVSWGGFRNRASLSILNPQNLIDDPRELIQVFEG